MGKNQLNTLLPVVGEVPVNRLVLACHVVLVLCVTASRRLQGSAWPTVPAEPLTFMWPCWYLVKDDGRKRKWTCLWFPTSWSAVQAKAQGTVWECLCRFVCIKSCQHELLEEHEERLSFTEELWGVLAVRTWGSCRSANLHALPKRKIFSKIFLV